MSGVEETYVIRVKTRVSGVATAHKSLIFKGSFRRGASFSVRGFQMFKLQIGKLVLGQAAALKTYS